MRCLVTGAAGFVGRALTRELIARGHEVIGTTRKIDTSLAFEHTVAELGDPDAIANAAKGVEVLFHCAGIASPHADRRALEWVNIAGTENVINAAREAQVRRVVFVSCADVSLINADRIHWGEGRVITQTPIDTHARTKLLAEEIALAASDQRLQVTALRPAWLWGPGDHTMLPQLCAEGLDGGVRLHGSGDNLLASLHIDNLVPALIAAATAEHAAGRAYYVADSDVLTAREFLTQLSVACGLPAPRRGVFAIDLALAWCNARFRDQPGAISDVVRRARGSLFDVQAAARDLNFTPSIDVATGMRSVATWVQAQGGAAAIAALRHPYVSAASVDVQAQRAQG